MRPMIAGTFDPFCLAGLPRPEQEPPGPPALRLVEPEEEGLPTPSAWRRAAAWLIVAFLAVSSLASGLSGRSVSSPVLLGVSANGR